MPGKQAKILSAQQISDLLCFARQTRWPARNRLIVLLSVKAGRRAGEIANLTWEMVLDPTGAIGSVIVLRDWAAKKKSGRLIPLHADLAGALLDWRHQTHAEAERYTEEADQAGLAEDAVIKLEGHKANRNAQTTSAGLGNGEKTQRKSK